MKDILAEILAHKRVEIAGLDTQALRSAAEQSPVPRDFRSAVMRRLSGNDSPINSRPKLIAELKRASPSKGTLAPRIDLFEAATIYASNGASAISVLTDRKYFLGELQTLYDLRFVHRTALPLLRKDFMIAESQLYEARANGADGVLLIAAALIDDQQFKNMHTLALELGLSPLVEVHNEVEVERALRLQNIQLIGINNRDLTTFNVSLSTSEHLRTMIPPSITVVSESGISTHADIERLSNANVDAVLIGEALITAQNIAEKVRELSGMNQVKVQA
jgi:indole-3-glycerol phosphate synthase